MMRSVQVWDGDGVDRAIALTVDLKQIPETMRQEDNLQDIWFSPKPGTCDIHLYNDHPVLTILRDITYIGHLTVFPPFDSTSFRLVDATVLRIAPETTDCSIVYIAYKHEEPPDID